MRIGVITFHAAFNYGSMLQVYAMQTFLERNGHEVLIINFRPDTQKFGYPKPLDFHTKCNVKRSLKRMVFAPFTIYSLYKKWNLFDKFLHSHLNITSEYNTLDELKKAHLDYDALITGSDQIWNTKAFDFSEAYFGTFVADNTRKIAYAPSMGPNPEGQDVEYLKLLLKHYSAVSVREERTKNFIEKEGIYKNVSLVLDPTMLLAGDDYEVLYDERPLVQGEYIFYYTPGCVRHEFLKEASFIGEKLGLPVICDSVYNPGDLRQYHNIKSYAEVGPAEFLNLIKNATVVCGASFHLMVFSILFRKEFYCMNGDIDSRMNNLMKMTGFEDRIWSIKNKKNNNIKPIVYADKSEILVSKYRDASCRFLYDALNCDFEK